MVAAAAFDEVAEEVCDTLAFLHRLQRAGKLDKEGPRQGSTRTKLIQSLYRLIDAQLASTEVGRGVAQACVEWGGGCVYAALCLGVVVVVCITVVHMCVDIPLHVHTLARIHYERTRVTLPTHHLSPRSPRRSSRFFRSPPPPPPCEINSGISPSPVPTSLLGRVPLHRHQHRHRSGAGGGMVVARASTVDGGPVERGAFRDCGRGTYRAAQGRQRQRRGRGATGQLERRRWLWWKWWKWG